MVTYFSCKPHSEQDQIGHQKRRPVAAREVGRMSFLATGSQDRWLSDTEPGLRLAHCIFMVLRAFCKGKERGLLWDETLRCASCFRSSHLEYMKSTGSSLRPTRSTAWPVIPTRRPAGSHFFWVWSRSGSMATTGPGSWVKSQICWRIVIWNIEVRTRECFIWYCSCSDFRSSIWHWCSTSSTRLMIFREEIILENIRARINLENMGDSEWIGKILQTRVKSRGTENGEKKIEKNQKKFQKTLAKIAKRCIIK